MLTQWVASRGGGRRFAWLSLDHADSDRAVFWSHVVGALRHAAPGLVPRAFELLEMGADLDQIVLPILLNELAALNAPMVLILDDYHLVTSSISHAQLTFVGERLPEVVRLVLAVRSDPPLPFARLRASQELHELRTGELRLDKHAFITEFTGNNRHIVDYLSRVVLDTETPEVRTFLMRTSVLPRLNGALCDAVLDSNGSGVILHRIESDSLLLVPLDFSRHWYRYHQLLAELLRTELRRTEPELVAVLHRRAAQWFRSTGLIGDAVRHFISADEVSATAELIAATRAQEFNAVASPPSRAGWICCPKRQPAPTHAW